MEIVNLDPYIVIYHDVINDAEIASLKEMSIPMLERGQAFHVKKKEYVVTNGRVAQLSSFEDDTNDLTKRLNQRIADMTGFDLTRSHELQINNYGLGGNFEPHYDFRDTTEVSMYCISYILHLINKTKFISDDYRRAQRYESFVNSTNLCKQ